MINQDELAVCGRRGHVAKVQKDYWNQCTACGMWVQEVLKLEEREDTPPENEWDALARLQAKYKDRT